MSDDNWADAMFSTDAAQGHHQGQVKMRAARIYEGTSERGQS